LRYNSIIKKIQNNKKKISTNQNQNLAAGLRKIHPTKNQKRKAKDQKVKRNPMKNKITKKLKNILFILNIVKKLKKL